MNQESKSASLTQIRLIVNSSRNSSNFNLHLEKKIEEFGLEAERQCLGFCSTAAYDGRSQLKEAELGVLFEVVLEKSLFVSSFLAATSLSEDKIIDLSNFRITEVAKNPTLLNILSGFGTYSLPDQYENTVDILDQTLSILIRQPEKYISAHLLHFLFERECRNYKSLEPKSALNNWRESKLKFSQKIKNIILTPLIWGFLDEFENISLEKKPAIFRKFETMDTSWSSLVLEVGYALTSNVNDCKSHLLKFCSRDVQPEHVSKILAAMCRTHTTNLADCNVNLPTPVTFWPSAVSNDVNASEKKDLTKILTESSTWKPEILVAALKEVAPNLCWKDVLSALDHPDFIIEDRAGLNLLITTIRIGCQMSAINERFPAECLYRHWKNPASQFSIVSAILKNPDLLSFADYIYTSVSVEVLKAPPESDSKDILAWKNVHMVDILLYLAENGFFPQVHEIFKFPVQHCPDILFMALLQISPPLSMIRQELFSNLIPTFLSNHPNSATILHHAWNSTNFNHSLRHIIMHSMSDWYMRGENDQSKLSRILDVAQDLKALSSLLNARSFMFVIDLACLASRREYLKLEKWLSDKIREHGEPFIQTIIKFLQRRYPPLSSSKLSEESVSKASYLPHETLSTIISCIQACLGNVQQELADLIIQVTTNCNIIVQKSRQPPTNVVRAHRGNDNPPFSGNLTTQQLFTPAIDSVSGLNSNLSGFSLTGGAGGFNFGNAIGNLAPTSASPSRMLTATSNSPFPGLSLSTTPQSVNNFSRIPPAPLNSEKIHLPAMPSIIPDLAPTVSKEVEDEANSYFQRIYNHPPHPTLSIDDVLDMLQRFKDSNIRREQEVYQCMLRNLFEEYRFFPQYPEKELQITAQLFGGIIDKNLVPSCVALGLALRCVLDALRKPEGSKMYYFGITALDRFKNRLHQYNKYCEYVRSIPHFQEFPNHLIQYVEYGFQSMEPPIKPPASLVTTAISHLVPVGQQSNQHVQQDLSTFRPTALPSNMPTSQVQKQQTLSTHALRTSRVKSIATATNIDTLLVANADREEKINIPPDSVQDKTAFIFNNLSQLNLQQKCEEIKEIMLKEYWAWMSQYLVLKRASIELNFHSLYSNFLDAMRIPEIVRLVTRETFRNIKVLLRSDKGIANFSDRSLLKNLGHWLGMMTLARNRPILQIDIDLKSLLAEAYHKGQHELLYVVPFVAKVLESCASSKVFKPPNPWTMAIMNVLAELHQESDLKLNLKFEIEVLCKTLEIDVSDLKPAIYLKDPDRALTLEYQLQPNISKIKDTSDDSNTAQLHSVFISDNCLGGDAIGQVLFCTPDPKFSFVDVNISNYSALAQYLVVSPNISILHGNPHLKLAVLNAMERTIAEWLQPVVDRSVRIGVSTCEQIIRKDFSQDPDEARMRTAAHYMVRNLTAGMAMITCKDQLTQSLSANIKKAFLSGIVQSSQPQDVETAAIQLASDNSELSCAFIQKTATEKAIPEIDRRLSTDFELRKLAREEGRRYFDSEVSTYQSERMPEQIRLKIGTIKSNHFAVYEQFARCIPGFQPLTEREAALFLPKPNTMDTMSAYGNDEITMVYGEIAAKMEAFLNSTVNLTTLTIQANKIHTLLNTLVTVRRHRDSESFANLLSRTVEGLAEGLVKMPEHSELLRIYREIHLRILNLTYNAFGANATERVIAKCLFECREEVRYNLEAIKLLITSHFINIQQFDILLSQAMDNGNNYLAVTFAMQLVQYFLIEERSNNMFSENDLCNTIELLARVSAHQRGPEGLNHIIEILRSNHESSSSMVDRIPSGPSQYIHSGIIHVRSNDCDDPPGLQEKTEFLLKDWVQIYYTQLVGRDSIKTFGMFVNKMNLYGILKTDDLITRFFRQATQFCMDLVYRHLSEYATNSTVAKAKIFQWIDAFVRLIALLVRHSGDIGNPNTKINLLNKVLGIVVGVLLQDQEMHGPSFQQLGYHRFFIMLFLELSGADPVLENLMVNIVTAFCHTFLMLNPAVAPGFCYSWLELISHRTFVGRLLAMVPQQKGWCLYAQLLMNLFKYLAPFLRNAELAKPVQLLYKGTLRVLLVLLHDFPEFLCDYHFGFCDVIPPNCIQMRNIILAAFPRNMRLPDPFTPNLKVDMLSETASAPRIYTNYVLNIQPLNFKKDLDSYLKARAPVTFLSELRGHLQISSEPGSKYNITLLNALVLYVGTQAISHIRNKNLVPNMTTIVHSAHMDIFQNLAVDLDNEGKYLFLNAIANQLRFPNSHTHYFSCAVLYLFVEANSEAIQEQITRVLLERLIVNRPHPWGLLITFIELIKNPIYKFWEHDFVHCAPEIEKLFESVARSCMVKATQHPQNCNAEADHLECN